MNIKPLKKLILIAGLASLPSLTLAAPDPNFHIYLMLGQSNMEGTAPIESQDNSTNPRVQVMQSETCGGNAYGTWRPALPTLIRCPRSGGGLGPGDTFGDALAEGLPSSISIGLVGGAYGGAKIEYFLPNCGSDCTPPYGGINGAPSNGTGGYKWVLDLAKKAQQKGVIKGFIFHQGESNSGQSGWPQKVNTFVTALRTDLGLKAEDSPFIAGELPYTGCCRGHNSLIAQLPSVITNAHVVSAGPENGQTLGDKGDQLHWNSAAVRIMGKRYAAKMLQVVKVETGPVNCGATPQGDKICCDISADDDLDGWGTQNGSEVCIVTSATKGYIAPNPADVVAAINVGSTQGASYNNIYYSADRDYKDGTMNTITDAVSGAGGSAVFQSERYGQFTYEIPVANGNYSVELDFAELYQTATAKRVFSVSVEDKAVLTNFDLFQQVGAKTAYIPARVNANVTDRSLSIAVSATVDNGTLSGIVIRSAAAPSSSSSVPASSSSSVVSSSSSRPASSSSSSAPTTTGGSLSWFILLMLGGGFVARRVRAA